MHCNMCSKCSRQPSSTAEEAGGNEYLQIVRGLQRGAFTAGGAGAMVNSDRLANKVEGVSKSEVEDEEDWRIGNAEKDKGAPNREGLGWKYKRVGSEM